MAVTILDVAKRAGVSATTVSLCFKGRTRISDSTRQKVLETAREIGYVPNQFARRLRLGRSKLIALIVPEIDTPFISDIVTTVENKLAGDGYNVLIFSTYRDCDLEGRAVQAAMELSVEGVIIAACEVESEALRHLCEGECPVVYIDSIPANEGQCGYVINDMTATGHLGTEHLLRLGHKRILLVNGPERQRHFSSFKHITDAYNAALSKHGMDLDERLIAWEGMYIDDGFKAVERALDSGLEFTAVFAISDLVALGAIQCLESHGLRVPDDVSVLGIDNSAMAGLDRISLTTIETYNPNAHGESMGDAAARMLLHVLESGDMSAHKGEPVVFKPRLVLRGSCRQLEPDSARHGAK